MALARTICGVVLTLALGAYALDCEAITTPEQAMACCAAMHCSRHGAQDPAQGMDCCKRMAMAHGPFVQPSSNPETLSPETFHAALVLAVLPLPGELQGLTSFSPCAAASSHAPLCFPHLP